MGNDLSIDELWNSVRKDGETFDPAMPTGRPQGARKYLVHAIGVGTLLATAVRLRMHGSIKLKSWYPFQAEEVIHWGRGLIWQAKVKMRGLTILGGDSFVDNRAEMRWKLFGILPLVYASGPDITRSAAGRMNVEAIWLPSVLTHHHVQWNENDLLHPQARFSAHGETAELDYEIAENGRLVSVNMARWGNPGGAKFAYYSCGGIAQEEGTF